MVGVPGRSKACQACRKRRIAKPQCGQCKKAKLECTTTKSLIFVTADQGSHKAIYSKSLNDAANVTVSRKEPGDARKRIESCGRDAKPSVPGDHQRALIPKQLSSSSVTQQQLLSTIAFNQVLGCPDEASILHTWWSSLTTFATSPHGLTSATLACYTAFLGRRDGDEVLSLASRPLYTQGLVETNRALRQTSKVLLDETLAACFALVMYEAIECPEICPMAYYWHRRGCLKLVELRGPHAHQHGLGHDLFLEIRLHGALDAYYRHEPNYICSPAWRTLPWEFKPKSTFQRLLDIFLLGPEVRRKADRLATTPVHDQPALLLALIDELWAIDVRLQHFLGEWEASRSEQLYHEQPATIPIAEGVGNQSPAFLSSAIHFPDIDTARIMTFYWAILAMVYIALVDLYAGLHAAGASHLIMRNDEKGLSAGANEDDTIPITGRPFIPPLGQRAHWIEPIRKVLQTVEYWQSPTALAFGPMRVTLAINVVMDILLRHDGYEAEYEWTKAARRQIGKNWMRILQCSTENDAFPCP